MKRKGKGLSHLIETAPPTAPGQDGFNHPSHVTKYAEGGFDEQYNMVGNCADDERDVDPRGRYSRSSRK